MSDVPYRISIDPALERFRPEIEHALAFVENCHKLSRTHDTGVCIHYGAQPPAGATVVPAWVFPDAVVVDEAGIRPRRDMLRESVSRCLNVLAPERSPYRRIAACDGRRVLAYDAIGLIFTLISRLEERDFTDRDRHGRYPCKAALAPEENGRLHAWADRAAGDIAVCLGGETAVPMRSQFSVKLTHDVDRLKGYHRPFEPIRHAAGDLAKRGNPSKAWSRLRDAYLRAEPADSFRRLASISEASGLRSHFYFMGPSDHPMDSPYAHLYPGQLSKMANEVRERGHVVGFHPGYQTATSPETWRRQRDSLESIIGCEVKEGRQHVLQWQAAITPALWSDSGMTADYTLAYPEVVGFRTGSCRPHVAYDLVRRRTLPLQQTATAVMDFGLLDERYLGLDHEAALEKALWALDVCKEFAGTFVILFHSGISDLRYWAFYEALLAACH